MWCPGQSCFPLHFVGLGPTSHFVLHLFQLFSWILILSTCKQWSHQDRWHWPASWSQNQNSSCFSDIRQRIQTPQIQGPPTNTSSWLLNFLSYWWEPYMPRDTVNSSLIHLPINSAIPQCSDGSNILCPCPGPNSYHLLPGTTWCSCLPRTQIRTRIPASYRLKIKKESYLFWLNIVVRLSNNSSCMSKSCVHAC